MKEKRIIKFYLDESVNNVKKDKIINFLKECQDVENQLLEYYWGNFDVVIQSHSQIDFNYKNKINYRDIKPQLKSHHFQQVIQKVYTTLKSLQSNIINNKVKFHFDDTNKQRIYNYCKGFCFDWDYLAKYINKQLKKYKNVDEGYYKFITMVKKYISDEDNFNELKNDIEQKFWEIKSKYKTPKKKEFQILCNKTHTINMEFKEFQWIFIIDNNDRIGGSDKHRVYDKLIIPVKYSKYHKKILKDKKLVNTFNLRLNKNNRIEIIGCYEVEVDYPKPNPNDVVGIDIGLKKLIVSSDGELVEINDKIIKRLQKLSGKQSNRDSLESHLRQKYNDKDFKLNNNRYLKQQRRLHDFLQIDNRYKVKQFLRGRHNQRIVMEDLNIAYKRTYSNICNYLIRRMRIQNIKNDILKYCKERGIKVSLINPAFTSQQCPICGNVSKENRKTQEMFCCVKCGHKDNADFNASINIRNRYNDKRIKLDTPVWRVKEILRVNT